MRYNPDDRCTDYALKVTQGLLPAGPHVRASCRRHLDDMEHAHKRGLYFSLTKAQRAWRFFEETIKLNGGQFEGRAFVLQPWQAFIIGSIFGWMRGDRDNPQESDVRRFRIAYVESGKGSGKSPLAGGIGLYCQMADREPRAEVYAAASRKDQAMVLFRDAVAMVRQSPLLMERLKISGGLGNEWQMYVPKTASKFLPISSEDGQSGPRPSCALVDEVHEHKNADVIELLRAGFKFRRQPFMLLITNSGAGKQGVCWDYHVSSTKIAAQVITGDDADTHFSYVCALDEGEDPFKDEGCWAKANPNLNVTFGPEFLRTQVDGARNMPSREGIVRRLHFCEWTEAAEHWIGQDNWDAVEHDFDPLTLRGLPCVAALDLSNKKDLTSLTLTWIDYAGIYWVDNVNWTPEDGLKWHEDNDKVPYIQWSKDPRGFLIPTPGKIVDKRFVAQYLKDLTQIYNIKFLVYDVAMAADFQAACDDIDFEVYIRGEDKFASGLEMVKHGQGHQGHAAKDTIWMPRSINEIEERVVKRTVYFRKNPVLRWASASAVLKTDEAGNRKWDKRKSLGRIDPMVTAAMGIGGAAMIDSLPTIEDDFDIPVIGGS